MHYLILYLKILFPGYKIGWLKIEIEC